MMMKATFAQKLIIQLLCDIHKANGINGELDADFISKAIILDSWAIDWRYGALFSDEDIQSDNPIVKEVADILQMFTTLNRAYDDLNQKERKSLESQGVKKDDLMFQGFDGNNDRHYGVARFMVEELDRFSEYKGTNLNSHGSWSLPMYRRMLPLFERVVRSSGTFGLPNADGIAEIMAAK